MAGKDPLEALRARIISSGLMSEAEVASLQAACEAEVEAAVVDMQAQPLLSAEAAFEDLLIQGA